MKKEFINSWKRSVQPRKQVKYRANAPLHVKRRFLAARLSKDLAQKHKTRSMPVRTGDRVRILRGNFRNHSGKVERVNVKYERIYIEGTERTKTDGTRSAYPIHPSNVIIQDLVMDDKRRKIVLERRGKK